jgi:hypothetical protein
MFTRVVHRMVLTVCGAIGIVDMGLAQRSSEALIVGQWHGQFQTAAASGDLYIEYSSDGHFRGIIYTPTQPITESQSFGTFSVHQDGAASLRIHRNITGHLPLTLCDPNGGSCRPVPPGSPQVDAQFRIARDGSLIDSNNMILRRESIPQQFLQVIPDRIFMHQVPITSAATPGRPSVGAVPGNPAIPGPTHMTPRIAPGNSDTCNDLQQNRLCTINGGYMYTDKRGCRMCQGPN